MYTADDIRDLVVRGVGVGTGVGVKENPERAARCEGKRVERVGPGAGGKKRKINVDDRPCFSVMSNTRCHQAHLLRDWHHLSFRRRVAAAASRARGANNNNLSAATGNNNGRPGNRYMGFIGFWPYAQ